MTKLGNLSKDNIELVKKLCIASFPENVYLGQLTAAQAILEGGLVDSPPSKLALDYCNLFGMKPGSVVSKGTDLSQPTPGLVNLFTREYEPGKGFTTVIQFFLANKEIEDSIEQHKKLLETLSRYHNLLAATSFAEASILIHQDGYATDPNYPAELMAVYNRYIK